MTCRGGERPEEPQVRGNRPQGKSDVEGASWPALVTPHELPSSPCPPVPTLFWSIEDPGFQDPETCSEEPGAGRKAGRHALTTCSPEVLLKTSEALVSSEMHKNPGRRKPRLREVNHLPQGCTACKRQRWQKSGLVTASPWLNREVPGRS